MFQKKSSLGPFFFPNLDVFFFGTFEKTLLSSAQLPVRFAPIFPWLSMGRKVDMSVSNGGWIRWLPSKDPI